MNVLSNIERRLSNLFEGVFSRAFKSSVRPLELASKLAREMELRKIQSLKKSYAPNEFVVWLSEADREHISAYEGELIRELNAYLLEHARDVGIVLVSAPTVEFRTDPKLRLGEFGIQARVVKVEQSREEENSRIFSAEEGHTMVYRTSDLRHEELEVDNSPKARLSWRSGSAKLEQSSMTIGRSNDCDIVLDNPDVSRVHARIDRHFYGFTITDLESTNGVSVNGREIEAAKQLRSGDRIELGTVTLQFEVDDF